MIFRRKISSNFLFYPKALGLVFLFTLIGSCTDFLDEAPDNRVEITDLDKAAQLLTNAYSIASPAFTDWMSDDFTHTIGSEIRQEHREMYAWEDVSVGPTFPDTPVFFWFQTYNAISHANEVLAIINDLPAEDDDEERRRDAIKSEAYLTRAYGHFMLVNMFGQTIGSGPSTPGVPYIKTPETTFVATYERETVRKVYDEIEDDLVRGLDLLDDTFFQNSGKYHFNRNAALAFASRFYLFKGDLIRCIEFSDELLGASPETYVRDMTSQEYRSAKSSATALTQLYASPDHPANLLLIRNISLFHGIAYGIDENDYGSLYATNPFGATDERENPAFVRGQNALFPVRYEGLFERSSINSNVGTNYHIALAFRGEEVLFNRIESNIYRNRLDEALADLQVLTNRRYTGEDVTLSMSMLRTFYQADDDPGFSDQDILLNYMLLERRKEFIAQGYRWYDIKRYNIQVTHVQSDGISTEVLQSDDRRKILQIPPSAVDVGGLEENPR